MISRIQPRPAAPAYPKAQQLTYAGETHEIPGAAGIAAKLAELFNTGGDFFLPGTSSATRMNSNLFSVSGEQLMLAVTFRPTRSAVTNNATIKLDLSADVAGGVLECRISRGHAASVPLPTSAPFVAHIDGVVFFLPVEGIREGLLTRYIAARDGYMYWKLRTDDQYTVSGTVRDAYARELAAGGGCHLPERTLSAYDVQCIREHASAALTALALTGAEYDTHTVEAMNYLNDILAVTGATIE